VFFRITVSDIVQLKKTSQNVRQWVPTPVDFYNHRVLSAVREVADAASCYHWLFLQASLNNGIVEITPDGLKAEWKHILCITSNNWDFQKRLTALVNAGLIEIETQSNPAQTRVKPESNPSQTRVKPESNPSQTRVKHGFEPAETRVAVISNNTNTSKKERKRERRPPKSPKGDSACFEKFWLSTHKRGSKIKALESWRRQSLDSLVDNIVSAYQQDSRLSGWTGPEDPDRYRFVPHVVTWLNQQRWEGFADLSVNKPGQLITLEELNKLPFEQVVRVFHQSPFCQESEFREWRESGFPTWQAFFEADNCADYGAWCKKKLEQAEEHQRM
jgi:hypothetical protein